MDPQRETKAKNPLVPRVLRHANRLHAFTRQTGRPDLAGRVAAEAERWKDQCSNVVVAGDIKAGKSSVINALVGEVGLLPVDADVATSAHVTVHHAPELRVVVTPRDASEPFAIAPAELREYASMAGEAGRTARVAAVDIGIPDDLLERGIALIDTPGVGSMAKGHRDITLATLNLADTLLFTVSAQEPVRRSELEFLLDATERIGTIVLVLTKIDLTNEWERSLDENRARIAEFSRQLARKAALAEAGDDDRACAERFARVVDAPFLAVSSRLAEKALVRRNAGQDVQAAELFERSGFAALERVLEHTATARENVRLLNILQLSESITARIEADEHERLRGADLDPHLEADMVAEQARMEAFVSRQARWRTRFATAVQHAQTELHGELARELAAIEAAYEAQLVHPSGDVDVLLDELPDELSRSIAACWWNLSALMVQRLDAAVAEVAAEFELEHLGVEASELMMTDRVQRVAGGRAVTVDKGFDLVEDGLPFASGTMMGLGAAGQIVRFLTITGPAVNPFIAGVGLTVGLGMLALRRGRRIDTKTRQAYLTAVRQALAVVKREFAAEMPLRLIEFRTQTEELLDERLAARRRELEVQRKELLALARQDAGARRKVRTEAEARVKGAADLRADAARFRKLVEAELGR